MSRCRDRRPSDGELKQTHGRVWQRLGASGGCFLGDWCFSMNFASLTPAGRLERRDFRISADPCSRFVHARIRLVTMAADFALK